MGLLSHEVYCSSSTQCLTGIKGKLYLILLAVAALSNHAISDETTEVEYESETEAPEDDSILSNISWVEEADDNGPINQDFFFDRVVFIAIGNSQPISPGVFFTRRHVLTSFNPYRQKYRTALNNVRILFLTGRILKAAEEKNLLQINKSEVICARQVVPLLDNWLTDKQWHGTNKSHSPLHDLLVLRIRDELEFLDPEITKHAFDNYIVNSNTSEYTPTGPIVTRIAGPSERLTRAVKFASLGFRSKEHIRMNTDLRSKEYEEDDNVIEECKDLFPNSWGRFICISNVDNYKGVGSGALLVHNDTVFGIGSFALKKGGKSILVFTDVRPYNDILFNICRDNVMTNTSSDLEATTSDWESATSNSESTTSDLVTTTESSTDII